jgi:hypothetical protein
MVGVERTSGHISHVRSTSVGDTQATDIQVGNPTPSITRIYASVVGTVADGKLIDNLKANRRTEALGETEVRGEEVKDAVESGAEHPRIVSDIVVTAAPTLQFISYCCYRPHPYRPTTISTAPEGCADSCGGRYGCGQ